MLHVCLFGDTQVRDGTRILGPGDFGGRKPRLILEALAVHRGRQVSKDRLVDILWQDRRPPDHVATLESYVSLLRRRLEPGTPARNSVIRTVPRAYLLDPSTTRTDLDLFDALVDEAGRRSDDEALSLLDRASALASTDLLASSDGAYWVEPVRVDYRRRAVDAALTAAELVLPRDPGATLRLAGRALELDVLCEPAWRLMMRAHAAAGHRNQALHAYRSCRRLLAEELGVAPTPGTRALVGQIIASTSEGPRTDAASARTADLGVVMDAAMVLFDHRTTGDSFANLDNAVNAVSELLAGAEVSLPATTRRRTPEAPLVIDDSVAMRSADAHLLREFGGVVRPEIVHALLRASHEDLATRTSFPGYLPSLAERAARRHLRDLADGNGRTPTVVFGPAGRGHSLMALGWFTRLAGDRAVAWHDGPPEHADASTVAAMAELGIDVTGEFRAPWIDGVTRTADVVVSFGEAAPALAPGKRQAQWTLDVPDTVDGVRAVRDEIERRVHELLRELGVRPTHPVSRPSR